MNNITFYGGKFHPRKRFTSILAFLLIGCLLLTGCGKKGEPSSSGEETEPVTHSAPVATTPPVTTTTAETTTTPPPVTTTTPPPETTTQAPETQAVSGDSDIASQLFTLVNNERASLGLPAYSYSSALSQSAYTRCLELPSTFSHTRPDGTTAETAAISAGYVFDQFGENIAETDTISAQQLFAMWKSSAGHYGAMTASYFTEMGVGIYIQNGLLYGVLHFGRPGSGGDKQYRVDYEGDIIDYYG